MNIKSKLIKPISVFINYLVFNKQKKAIEIQKRTLLKLIKTARNTLFGLNHHFSIIKDYDSFKNNVSIRDYEQLKLYNDKIIAGKKNICRRSKPKYFAKTSGTTSGSKYIPITKESINHHIIAARNALFAYVSETGKVDFFNKKMIFLQGSPILNDTNGIATGRLSGLVYHHVPNWLVKNRKPSYDTNCISNWEQKVDAIVEETYQEDMGLISGIPPWCIMYFEKLIKKTGKKTIKEIFPNFKLFVYGGLNYEPYREKIERLIGFEIDTIETYPASEGFFAYQDSQNNKGLLLNIDAGIFYEFIKTEDILKTNPKRICLEAVELETNYVLVVSTNAGLWAYNTGDTIKFVSLSPYRIKVTGRVKHFISAFGEHVIAEEIESVITQVCKEFNISINEFTVAPFVSNVEGLDSYHEWFVEVSEGNFLKENISLRIDTLLQEKNIYYKDLREGNVLSLPKINLMKENGFKKYQLSKGKFGGQNKVVHLSNDRKIAKELQNFVK